MKIYATIFLFICLSFGTIIGQSHITLVKSIAAKDVKFMSFNLGNDVNVEHWEKDVIRLEIFIKANHINEKILKRLCMLGRYEIKAEQEMLEMKIDMPKLKHIIMIAGKNLEEEIQFKVMVPKGILVKLNHTASLVAIGP